MRKWEGFVKESKKFNNYPHCGRVWFWTHLPRAAVRYYWGMSKAWLGWLFNGR